MKYDNLHRKSFIFLIRVKSESTTAEITNVWILSKNSLFYTISSKVQHIHFLRVVLSEGVEFNFIWFQLCTIVSHLFFQILLCARWLLGSCLMLSKFHGNAMIASLLLAAAACVCVCILFFAFHIEYIYVWLILCVKQSTVRICIHYSVLTIAWAIHYVLILLLRRFWGKIIDYFVLIIAILLLPLLLMHDSKSLIEEGRLAMWRCVCVWVQLNASF